MYYMYLQTDTRVPPALRNKVETFYKMYWHKQRAVSKTQLLPTYPPTLPATINLDIYFEATQKVGHHDHYRFPHLFHR